MDAKSMESAARARSARITDRLRAAGIERGVEWNPPTRRLQAARARLDRFAAWLHFEPQSPEAAGFYARSGNYLGARMSTDALQPKF